MCEGANMLEGTAVRTGSFLAPVLLDSEKGREGCLIRGYFTREVVKTIHDGEGGDRLPKVREDRRLPPQKLSNIFHNYYHIVALTHQILGQFYYLQG